jgi:hypothetical protein
MLLTSGKQGETDEGDSAVGTEKDLSIDFPGLLVVDDHEVQPVDIRLDRHFNGGVRIDVMSWNFASAGIDFASFHGHLDLPCRERAEYEAVALSLLEGSDFLSDNVIDQTPQRDSVVAVRIGRRRYREVRKERTLHPN